MVSHSLVIGYHGCDFPMAVQVIARGGDLKPSQNAWDWLGHGIYSWEDSYARAMRWAEAEMQRHRARIQRPVVQRNWGFIFPLRVYMPVAARKRSADFFERTMPLTVRCISRTSALTPFEAVLLLALVLFTSKIWHTISTKTSSFAAPAS